MRKIWNIFREVIIASALVLIAVILLSGCVTQKACDRKFPPQVSDSVSVVTIRTTVYRDTTIIIRLKGDTVERVITVNHGVNGLYTSAKSVLNTPLAVSNAWVDKGKLYHNLQQKDTAVATLIKNAIRDQMTSTVNDHVTTVVKEVNYLTGWQWFQVWTGRILSGVFLLGLILFVLSFVVLKR